jgi:insulysin
VEKSRSNTNHPYSKFYTGNKSTLLDLTKKNGIDLRTELIKFWGTYYSANQMSLAIVAPQSISSLKKMVNDAFGGIPNNPDRSTIKPEEDWAGKIPPFLNGNSIIPAQKSIVEIVPVADMRQVAVTFPIAYQSLEEKEDRYVNKPEYYLTHLLGHEGPNSLLSYLQKKGLANGVSAGTEADLSDFYTIEVAVQLTNKGLQEVNDVIEAIFSYIRMIREDPIPKFTFDEVLMLNEMNWRFLTKGSPGTYVQGLVKGMQEYPESLYIAGPRRFALRDANARLITTSTPSPGFAYDAQLDSAIQSVSETVKKLTVDNAMVTVTSKSLEGKANKKEKWYGTKYSVKPLSPLLSNQWNNCPSATSLGIAYPRPNPFIPSENGLRVKKPIKNIENTEVLSFEERMKPIPPPELIRDDGDQGKWSVYFKQDDRFGQPKAIGIFRLLTKEVYNSPVSAILSKLYQVSLSDRLKEYTYDASLAGLSYDVQVTPRGVRLLFAGYNDKLLDFATYVTKKVSQDISQVLPENEDEFERYKDEIVRALGAFDVQQVYSHAIYYSNLAVNPKSSLYTNAELRDAIEKVNLNDLTNYAKGLWKSGKAEALIQGNIDKNEALQFVDVIDKTLNFQTISKEDIPDKYDALNLPCATEPTKITVAEPNPNNKNAASQVSLQCIDASEKAHVLVEIISAILSERFYEDLRTRQQVRIIPSYHNNKLILKTNTYLLDTIAWLYCFMWCQSNCRSKGFDICGTIKCKTCRSIDSCHSQIFEWRKGNLSRAFDE